MKNLKLFLLLNIVLFFHAIIPAQEHTISLQGKILNLPDNPYQVVEVIDAREEKSCLGYVNYMMNENKRINVPVTMKSDLSESLLSLFKSGFTDSTTRKPLVIKINRLFVYDLDGKNDLEHVIEINLDFYIIENGIYYHEFNSGHYKNSTAHSISHSIDNLIINAVEQCYIEYLHQINSSWGYHEEVGKDELYANSLNQEFLSQTRSDFDKSCIFHTFNNFRDNIADTLTPFTLNLYRGKEGLGYCRFDSEITEKGDFTVNEIWGAYFNNKIYIQVGGYFIPVEVTQNGYTIKNMSSFVKHSYARRGFKIGYNSVFIPTAIIGLISLGPIGIVFPSVVLGALGGGVGAVIGTFYPKIEIMDEEYKLDMATGMPIPVEEPAYRKFAGELIFLTEKYKGQNPELFVNGKKAGSFQPKSYISVIVPKENTTVEIYLKSTNDEFCKTVSVDIFNTNYYEVKIRGNGQVKFIPLTAEKKKSSKQKKIEDGKFEKILTVIE